MKWLRKLLGLCEHDWQHATNVLDTKLQPVEVLRCSKCHRTYFRYWPRGS